MISILYITDMRQNDRFPDMIYVFILFAFMCAFAYIKWQESPFSKIKNVYKFGRLLKGERCEMKSLYQYPCLIISLFLLY
jgi:hypothetical protein